MTSGFIITIHALVFLNHKTAVHSSEGLVENVCTNPARVRKVMAKLKKVDSVKTKEGVDGGCLFHRNSREINLTMVADALEVPSMTVSWKNGNPHMSCLVSSGMARVVDGLYDDLDQCCQKRLTHVTIADLDKKIFGKAAAN